MSGHRLEAAAAIVLARIRRWTEPYKFLVLFLAAAPSGLRRDSFLRILVLLRMSIPLEVLIPAFEALILAFKALIPAFEALIPLGAQIARSRPQEYFLLF